MRTLKPGPRGTATPPKQPRVKHSPRRLPLLLVTWGGENIAVRLGPAGPQCAAQRHGPKVKGGGQIGTGTLARLAPACRPTSPGREERGWLGFPGRKAEGRCHSWPWGWGGSGQGPDGDPPR